MSGRNLFLNQKGNIKWHVFIRIKEKNKDGITKDNTNKGKKQKEMLENERKENRFFAASANE